MLAENPQAEFLISLERQTFGLSGTDLETTFDIDPFRKVCLINGYDDLDYLLSQREDIIAFEERTLVAI